jgi:hypothetical protein
LAALLTHTERSGDPSDNGEGTRAAGAPAVYPARNAEHFARSEQRELGGLAPAAEDEAAEGDAQSERAEGERADRD